MKGMFALRPLLWFDAATCAAMGLLLLAAQRPLSSLLGLPPWLLLEAGFLLLPFALFVAWSAAREGPKGFARLVVAVNGAWVVGSVVLTVGPWLNPTPLGSAFLLIQAAAVAAIATLQLAVLRREAVAA